MGTIRAVQEVRSRSFAIALVGLGYVLFAALQSRGGAGLAWISLVVLPVALGFAWIKSAPPRRGVDPVDPAVRSAGRVAATGAAILLASWTGVAGDASLSAAANIGTALASLAALVSLARIAPGVGLLQAPPATRRMDAVALASLFWGIAVVVPGARAIFPERTTLLDPLAIDYATTVAAAGSVGLIVAAAARLRTLRRLELGAADRASAALALSVVVLALAAPTALLRVAPPDRVMAGAATLASAAVLFASISREPTRVAQTMRTVLAIVVLGAPVGLAGVALSLGLPAHTGVVVLFVAAASVVVGIASPYLARPLGPARSRWLDAIRQANDAALHPDPDVALRDALSTVRAVLPGESASPLLFRASPQELITIDRAGYLHFDEAEAPVLLYELADQEPERAVRVEVLRALEVRRAELRPVVQWLDSRGVLVVTAMRDEEGPVGLIGLPRGKRRSPMNLEEVRALRVLADRIGAVLGVSSALARSRSREMDLRRLADRRGDEIDRLKHRLAAAGGRNRSVTERLAQPVLSTCYSPAATMAVEQLRHLGSLGVSLTLLTPPGVNPIPWAAVAHLAGSRRDRPLAFVQGTDRWEHDLDRWRDPAASPLVLANGGTLFVVDVASLPLAVQGFIAASLAERASPSGTPEPLDVALGVSVPSTVDALVAGGRLSTVLADWLGDRALGLPALATRGEDLRSVTLDWLAKLGIRFRGSPFGIEDAALGRLMNHDWPGNDLELHAVLLRASQLARGSRVTADDLNRMGFWDNVKPPLGDDRAPRIPPVRRRARKAR